MGWTKRFTEIAGALAIPGEAIIDGEVVVVHEARTNFSELQAELAAGRQGRLSCRPFGPATSSSWINLGSHRSKSSSQLIRSVGAKLFFLPKYSPDLNPIEQVFAKLKHLVRKAAARTVEAVCTAIGH